MMLPPLGTVSAYAFTTGFTVLDGIYTLTEIMTFSQAISNGVDFVKSLYTPADMSPSQYPIDAPSYVGTTVLMLTPANDPNGTVIFVPNTLLALQPDSMVKCVNQLAIGVNLGLFDNQDTVTWVLSELNQILMAALGIDNPAILYSLGTQYVKVTDYEAQVAARAAAATGYNTLYSQLVAQIQLRQDSQNLVQYYEDALIALATP